MLSQVFRKRRELFQFFTLANVFIFLSRCWQKGLQPGALVVSPFSWVLWIEQCNISTCADLWVRQDKRDTCIFVWACFVSLCLLCYVLRIALDTVSWKCLRLVHTQEGSGPSLNVIIDPLLRHKTHFTFLHCMSDGSLGSLHRWRSQRIAKCWSCELQDTLAHFGLRNTSLTERYLRYADLLCVFT